MDFIALLVALVVCFFGIYGLIGVFRKDDDDNHYA